MGDARETAPDEQRPAGRPCKLTDALQQTLCNALAAGAYPETAAALAGIDRTTFHSWVRRGRERGKGKFYRFAVAVEKALAASELRDLVRIQKAADKHWQASAWRLERRFPERWGRRSRDEIAAKTQPTPEETAAEIRRFLAAADAIERAEIPPDEEIKP